MTQFEQLMQDIVNKDYPELIAFGKTALSHLMPVFQEVDKENNGYAVLSAVTLAAIGADGVLTSLERAYLRDVTGLDDETISKFIELYDSNMVDLTDTLFDALQGDMRSHLAIFILSILAVDEKISREETAFVQKLFS